MYWAFPSTSLNKASTSEHNTAYSTWHFNPISSPAALYTIVILVYPILFYGTLFCVFIFIKYFHLNLNWQHMAFESSLVISWYPPSEAENCFYLNYLLDLRLSYTGSCPPMGLSLVTQSSLYECLSPLSLDTLFSARHLRY